jgi:hypothetical protein
MMMITIIMIIIMEMGWDYVSELRQPAVSVFITFSRLFKKSFPKTLST